MSEISQHKRVNDILLGPLERPALHWLAAHMPAWITPDICTLIGLGGAVMTLAGYGLSNVHPGFLWLASLGFLINWFGDSLDGTLARHRHIERPRYGYFVDHTTDAAVQVMIFLGLGLISLCHLQYCHPGAGRLFDAVDPRLPANLYCRGI